MFPCMNPIVRLRQHVLASDEPAGNFRKGSLLCRLAPLMTVLRALVTMSTEVSKNIQQSFTCLVHMRCIS